MGSVATWSYLNGGASLGLELVTNDYVTGETMTIDGGLTMRVP